MDYPSVVETHAGAGGTEAMAKIWKIYRVQAADHSPAMSWTSHGCSKSETLPVALPPNISNLTRLMNSSWVQELLRSGLHPEPERRQLSPH